jgi:hypothetical protein
MSEGFFSFATDFVFVTRAKTHNEIKAELLPKIEASLPTTAGQHKGRWLCDVNTEFFSMVKNDTKYSRLIHTEVFPAVVDAMKQQTHFYKPATAEIVDIWYNRYSTAGTQEVHTHGTEGTFSGVYVLEAAEESPLVFFSPQAANAAFLDGTFRPHLNEGDIVLFPNHLPHYVLPCTSVRTTISFNVLCTFF